MKSIVLSCLIALFLSFPVGAQNAKTKKSEKTEIKKEGVADKKQKGTDDKSQEHAASEQDVKELENLRKERNGLQDSYEELKDKIKDTQGKLDDTKKKLDDEREHGKSVEYQNKIDGLETYTDSLAGRIIFVTDSLTGAFNYERDKLSGRIYSDSMKIVKLNDELNGIKSYKNRFLTRLVSNVESDWINRKYSEVDSTELDKVFRQCRDFEGENDSVASAYEKLKSYVDAYRLYNDGIRAINSPYDDGRVQSLLLSVNVLKGSNEEMATLAHQLSGYKSALYKFKEMMKTIYDSTKDVTDSDFKIYNANYILRTKNNEGVIDTIKFIPWLNEQYRILEDSLKNNILIQVDELELEK